MMIPVLLAFMLFMLWVVQLRDASLNANIDAQTYASEEAVLNVQEHRLVSTGTISIDYTESIEQLVRGFQSGLNVGAGVAKGNATRETSAGFHGIVEGLGPVHGRAEVMSHAMKSEVFDFPHNRSAQPPLTLPEAVRGIAPGYRSFTDFGDVLLRIGQ